MSREVDERIVEMQFDNKQFESGVSQTIKSLDALTNALKFEGIGDSIRGLQNSMNFSGITEGFENMAYNLTTITGKIKQEVFDRIANYAVNTGEKVINALTLGGAKSGMAEYETQMGAVQTILANTQHLGTTITDVNKALDDLNEYADLTIYNFTEMTKNIGTFTAAGLDLETSTSAIKGIANLAAVSGSTSEQASRAMYQLSQALAAGRVNLQDWNSVVNAGMGGKVFQDALKRTAKHMGVVVDESKNFRETIQGKDTWLTADILSETLKQFSGDLDEAQLLADGWSETEIKEITDMAKTATDAATVVKTMKQLLDTVNEQIGSGWTKTWQLIFGDFEESKALWTSVYKAISPYIDAISDLRNGYLQFWKENEGRDKVLKAFSNIWSAVSQTIDQVASRFRMVFPIFNNFGQKLVDLSDQFLAFSERFKGVKKVAEDATSAATKMVSRISDAEKAAANAIWYTGKYGNGADRIRNLEAEGLSYEHVQGYLEALIAADFDAAKADEQFMESVSDTTAATEELGSMEPPTVLFSIIKILRNLADVSKNVIEDSKKIAGAIKDAFTQVFKFTDIFSKIEKISGRFKELSDTIRITDSALGKITRIARGVFSVFKIIGDVLYGVGMALFDIFQKLFPTVSELGGNLLESAASIGDFIYNFSQTHDVATIVHDAIMKVVNVFENFPEVVGKAKDAISNFFGNLLNKIKEGTGIDVRGFFVGIKDSINGLFDKFKESTGIDVSSIFSSFIGGLGSIAASIIHLDFKGAFDAIINAFVSFKDSIKTKVESTDPESIFGKFISAMKSVVSKIGEVFKGLFSKDSNDSTVEKEAEEKFSVFEWIGEKLGAIAEFVSDAVSFAVELFSEIFGFIGDFLSQGFDEDDTAFEKVKKIILNIGDLAKEILKIIAPFAGLSMAKDLTSMPGAVAGFIESSSKAMDAITKKFGGDTSVVGTIERIIGAILKLAAAIFILALLDESKIAVATGAVTAMMSEIIGALIIMQKYLKSDVDAVLLTTAMSQIGSAIFKIALAVAFLSLFNPAKIAVGTGAVVVMIAALVGALVAMQKFLKADIDFTKVTAVFMKLAWTMVILGLVVAVLAGRDPAHLATAVGGVVVLLFAIVGVVAILQKSYNPAHGQTALKNMSYIAGLAIAIAQAAKMLVDPVKQLGTMKPEQMMLGLLGVTNILLALTGIVYLLTKIKVSEDAIETAIALIAAAVAVKLLTDSAVALGKEGSDKVLAASAGIYAMVGALAVLVGLMILVSKISSPGQIVAVSIALLAAVYALRELVPVIVILGTLKPENLGSALMGLGLALLSLTAVLAILSYVGGANVLLVAAGLFILAEAVKVIVPPLIRMGEFVVPLIEKLTKTKWKTLGKGLLIVAVALVAMVVAGPALAIFGAGLAIVGVALAIISASILMASVAFEKFARSLVVLATVWPLVKNIIPEIGSQLAKGVTNFLTTFVNGMTDVFKAIQELAPEIAETVKIVLKSILEMLIGWAPEIVEHFLVLFKDTLTILNEHLPEILSLIGQLIDTILIWLEGNVLDWSRRITVIVMDILTGVITGLTDRVDELVTAIFDFVIALNNAIANALNTKGDAVVDSFAKVITAFVGLIKRTLVKLEKKVEEIGGNVIDYVITGIKNAGSKLVKKIKDILTVNVPNGIKAIWSKLQEIGGDIIAAAVEGLQNAGADLVQAVKDLAGGAVDALTGGWDESSPSKATYKAGEYFVEGAVDAVEDNEDSLSDATESMANSALDTFANSMSDIFDDIDIAPMLNITPDANIDMSNVEAGITDANDYSSGLFDTSAIASNIDVTSSLAGMNADIEAERTDSVQENSSKMDVLSDKLSALTERLGDKNIISVPDNATFNIPVNVDGQTIATASAPYLDTIQADGYNLEAAGVTSW